jgi:hypothetical protein
MGGKVRRSGSKHWATKVVVSASTTSPKAEAGWGALIGISDFSRVAAAKADGGRQRSQEKMEFFQVLRLVKIGAIPSPNLLPLLQHFSHPRTATQQLNGL